MREAITSRIKRLVWDKTDGRCWYCGIELHPFGDYKNPHRNFEIDHMLAASKGGSSELKNLVPACKNCNRRKSDMRLEEFRRLRAWQEACLEAPDSGAEPVVQPLTFFGEKLQAERKAAAEAVWARLQQDPQTVAFNNLFWGLLGSVERQPNAERN